VPADEDAIAEYPGRECCAIHAVPPLEKKPLPGHGRGRVSGSSEVIRRADLVLARSAGRHPERREG
jgi:hypothetical protein